jgi:hypothetical protein
MKFWKSRDSGERKGDRQQTNMYAAVENVQPIEHKMPWLLVSVTFSQILPGTDLYLCINERGEVALIALPDLVVSGTLGEILREQPHPSVILIQRIEQGKDDSYLCPAIFTDKQSSIMPAITSAFNNAKLEEVLKKHNWQKILREVTANNSSYINTEEYQHRISRIKIVDIVSLDKPDDSQRIPGYQREIPVFLYAEPDIERELSKQELQRELTVRRLLCEQNIDSVRNTLRMSPVWSHLQENDLLVHVINRVEIEIKLHMKAWPSFADILLNPEMAEFNPEASPEIKFTPKGKKILKQTESRELIFSISNWGDPDIAQVALHVRKFNGQSPKDSVTAPSVTIFKDEMGTHALQAKLFRIPTASFSLGGTTNSPIFLDDLPASQIPEISWKSIGEETTSEWWQTDIIAKKVLWLATYNLASHAVGDPEEVIYSVTPIGNDVIQVASLFDNLEEGAPYAFAIIREDFAIKAIPVFPSGSYEVQPDGALVSKTIVRLKNYCITRNSERIDLQSMGQITQFIKPIYSTIIGGEYKEPKIYEVGSFLGLDRKEVFTKDITAKSNLALCMWKMGVQLKGRNSYVMLIFTADYTFQFNIVEMEPEVKDANDAVCKLFGVSHPIGLLVERPKPSFNEVTRELNPIHLLNPKYIPRSAILPDRNDNKVCLCLETVGEFLQVGLMLGAIKPAMARVNKNNEETASVINLISDVCKGYLCNMPFPKDYINSLASLLAIVRTENLS